MGIAIRCRYISARHVTIRRGLEQPTGADADQHDKDKDKGKEHDDNGDNDDTGGLAGDAVLIDTSTHGTYVTRGNQTVKVSRDMAVNLFDNDVITLYKDSSKALSSSSLSSSGSSFSYSFHVSHPRLPPGSARQPPPLSVVLASEAIAQTDPLSHSKASKSRTSTSKTKKRKRKRHKDYDSNSSGRKKGQSKRKSEKASTVISSLLAGYQSE
mmetsp:Transcript_1179/g.2208  ORF Transcript_1179/g.2208 Transcript_1179/m.2208 type:complete len:212 (-) Transcript_1179:65-700(-)